MITQINMRMTGSEPDRTAHFLQLKVTFLYTSINNATSMLNALKKK